MRASTITLAALVLVSQSACEHVVYYSPSGPGRTVVGKWGAPSSREIKIDAGATVSLWINNESVPSSLTVFVNLRAGVLRLKSPELQFFCPSETATVTIEKISAFRVLDGNGDLAEAPWQTELVQPGAALTFGGVSDGRYWIEATLPSCAQDTFSVNVPAFAGRGANLPGEPVVFRLRDGYFIPFHAVM